VSANEPADKDATLSALIALFGPQGVRDWNDRAGLNGRERFLAVLERDLDLAIRELESDAQHHQDRGEDLMTRMIVSFLRGRQYSVKSDPNERGHTDILVEHQMLNLKWIGEAKIHTAYPVNAKGLRQLLFRYASGADDRGGLILYVFNENALAMMDHWQKYLMDPGLRMDTLRIEPDLHGTRFRFLSIHKHPVGIEFTIRHHFVLLHFAPRDRES